MCVSVHYVYLYVCVCVWSTERENIYVRETEKACVCILRERVGMLYIHALLRQIWFSFKGWTGHFFCTRGKVLGSLCTLVMQVKSAFIHAVVFQQQTMVKDQEKRRQPYLIPQRSPTLLLPQSRSRSGLKPSHPRGIHTIGTLLLMVCMSVCPAYVHHVCVLMGVCVFVHVCVTVCVFAQVHLAHVHHVCIGVCVFLCLCVCPSLSSACTPHLCNLRWMCVYVFLDSTVVRLTGSCIYKKKKKKSYICKCFCLNDTVMFYTRCVYVCRCVCVHLCLCVCCLSLSRTCTPHLSNLRWICAVFLGSAVVKLTGSCIN